jgi:hypothetical protein
MTWFFSLEFSFWDLETKKAGRMPAVQHRTKKRNASLDGEAQWSTGLLKQVGFIVSMGIRI